jgi:hypothetical protein
MGARRRQAEVTDLLGREGVPDEQGQVGVGVHPRQRDQLSRPGVHLVKFNYRGRCSNN